MTNDEAFRLGFLARCAEGGLAPAAVAGLVKRADGLLGAVGALAGGLGAAALAAPPALGYLGGYGLARAADRDVNPDDVKKQELIAEYRRLASRARQSRLQRRLREGGLA